jgi:excisionase family DNA binding protein
MNRDLVDPESTKSAHASESDAIMTPPEAAEYLRISMATLLRGSRLGEIPGFQVGKKLWRYRKSLLDEWVHSKVSSFRHPCRK